LEVADVPEAFQDTRFYIVPGVLDGQRGLLKNDKKGYERSSGAGAGAPPPPSTRTPITAHPPFINKMNVTMK
jgi:hypothetical protein